MSPTLFRLVNTHLPADGVALARFSGEEAVNATYRFDVVCRAALPAGALAALEMSLPGSRASLELAAVDGGSRWIHGVVSSLDMARSLERDEVELHARIEPRLALLDLTTTSTIYQNLTVPEVAAELLARWNIPHELRLQATYRKRTYLTQYRETDLAFFTRILAAEGIFFSFEHPSMEVDAEPAEEHVVLCDAAELCRPIAGDSQLRFEEGSGALEGATLFDHVTSFGRARRLRPQAVLVGDYDHRNPGLPIAATARATSVPAAATEGDQLRAYHHAADAEIEGGSGSADLDNQRAKTLLEQHRVGAVLATGKSHSRRLAAGQSFTLEGHAVEHLNAGYSILRVRHDGRVPELTEGDADHAIYENVFECVPDDVPLRPPPMAARAAHVAETATVIATGGEDIHTDDLGRIQVRFHWDLGDRSEEGSACWLRVAQPWAGTHFGAQFIPRAGDEVIVTFLGGDPDRPIVTGAVYNGTHPNPFDLPEQKETSGFRTQSTPGGSGYNELSFCDRIGEERIFVRAERDLVHQVENDHQLRVARHHTLTVAGAQTFSVANGQTMQIGGAQVVNIAGNQQLMAAGSGLLAYGADADLQIGRQLTTRVDGREVKEVRGQSNELYRDDLVTRVLGHATTIVGADDARRAFNLHVEGTSTSHASGTLRLSSAKAIELSVGDSLVRISEEGIELSAKKLRVDGELFELRAEKSMALEAPDQLTLKSDKVLMQSESAFLGLGKVAKLKGELVKLNCQDDPVDDLDPPEAPELTTIRLQDEDGKPLANQRFVLVLPDGSEMSGTLDETGSRELEVEASGDIIFPDVHNPRPA